jgi:hypothetical protein
LSSAMRPGMVKTSLRLWTCSIRVVGEAVQLGKV